MALNSVPPLDNNSIPAGFDPIESEGAGPIGMVRKQEETAEPPKADE